MSAKAHITADFPTQHAVASRLGIKSSRAAELREQMIELHRKTEGSIMKVKVVRRAKKK